MIVQAEVEIEAEPEQVWAVLTDLGAYHEWSTLLHYLGGEPRVGERLHLRLTVPGGPSYSFRPVVTDRDEGRRFGWKAATGVAGIFDGAHVFALEAAGPGRTRLINREVFSGLATPLVRRMGVLRDAEAGFRQMNEEIRSRVGALVPRSA